MKIALGSTSEEKKRILMDVISKFNVLPEIIGVDINSMIVDQPLDEATTIKGAFNRAIGALDKVLDCGFSIGLEGGLSLIGDNYFLVCAAVIIDKKRKSYIGMSSKFPLPKKISDRVKRGEQFGVVVREFEADKQIDDNIRLVVVGLIKRDVAFAEAIRNSYQAYKNKKHY